MIQRDGIIVVDKESGPSSFEIVQRVKNLIKLKKAGHAGTLDPFASGVLVVLLNQGTKLCPFLMSQDKVYRAALRLGIETDTQDLTGRIVKEKKIGRLRREDIERATRQYVGAIKQVPPPYSAVHHDGKRAYELARKGMEVELEGRDVRIDYIDVVAVDLPTVWIEVGCSSGTYLRSLAADIGSGLGTGAHLGFLRRIRSGPFLIDSALSAAEIAQEVSSGCVQESIISLKDALKGMTEVDIPPTLARKIRNGYQPDRGELCREDVSSLHYGDYIKVVVGDELVAVLREGRNGYEIQRVFTQPLKEESKWS